MPTEALARGDAEREQGVQDLEPAVAAEAAMEEGAGRDHDGEDDRVAPGLVEFGHDVEVHAVDAGDHRGGGHDGDPGRDLAHVLVGEGVGTGEGGLQDRAAELVGGVNHLADPREVIADVTEVVAHLRGDHPALRQRGERRLQRHDRPLHVQHLPLELVDAVDVPGAHVGEDGGLDLFELQLHQVGDLQVPVDDVVGDGVQDPGGTPVHQLGPALKALAHLAQRAVLAVPHGHHEVGAEEDHDLAGADDLAGRGELVVVEVGDALEDHEERVAVPLDLGTLVRLDGVLDGERVQVEDLGQPLDLRGGRLVQTDPDERLRALDQGVVLTNQLQRLDDAGRADLEAVDVGTELHYRVHGRHAHLTLGLEQHARGARLHGVTVDTTEKSRRAHGDLFPPDLARSTRDGEVTSFRRNAWMHDQAARLE